MISHPLFKATSTSTAPNSTDPAAEWPSSAGADAMGWDNRHDVLSFQQLRDGSQHDANCHLSTRDHLHLGDEHCLFTFCVHTCSSYQYTN